MRPTKLTLKQVQGDVKSMLRHAEFISESAFNVHIDHRHYPKAN